MYTSAADLGGEWTPMREIGIILLLMHSLTESVQLEKPAEYGVTTGERNENIKLRLAISREFQ